MILRATNIYKSFRRPHHFLVLIDVSLEANAGESIAITGRSGEGKTTLLHILGTLESFDSGELIIGEKSISNPTLRNQKFGFIFQSFNLLEDFTALENVLMPARIGKFPVSRQKGLELLAAVDLQQRADFPAKLLSGGERQRIAIARALCNDPEIIFADEPSGNLDAANAKIIGDLLFNLVRERKKTLILATHDETLAKRCDRRFLLSNGKLS